MSEFKINPQDRHVVSAPVSDVERKPTTSLGCALDANRKPFSFRSDGNIKGLKERVEVLQQELQKQKPLNTAGCAWSGWGDSGGSCNWSGWGD